MCSTVVEKWDGKGDVAGRLGICLQATFCSRARPVLKACVVVANVLTVSIPLSHKFQRLHVLFCIKFS